jgi:hypothetical protein
MESKIAVHRFCSQVAPSSQTPPGAQAQPTSPGVQYVGSHGMNAALVPVVVAVPVPVPVVLVALPSPGSDSWQPPASAATRRTPVP